MPGYEGNTLDDLDPNHPYDTESIGTAAPAIRQIKRVLKNEGEGSITELVKKLIKENMYQVGDYYITDLDTNPAEIFGGEWEKIDGKFLVSSGKMTFNTGEQLVETDLPISNWGYMCSTPHIGNIGRSTMTIEGNQVVFTFPDSDGVADPGRQWDQYFNVRMWCALDAHAESNITGNAQLSIKITDASYMASGGPSWSLYARTFDLMFSNNTDHQPASAADTYYIGTYTFMIGSTTTINLPISLQKDYKYLKLCARDTTWAAEWRLRNVFKITAGKITKTYASSEQTLELEAGDTGGEFLHQLTEEEVPDARTQATLSTASASMQPAATKSLSASGSSRALEDGTVQPHNNMPPYLVTNIWRRNV